ncbi:hypothetical protein BDV93DRAFT_542911 [Ceratobasidium sp. AG-I]|nr:hypothetical protein BDV93DRAFT_542911 [Ceratobasidium sp. AG-I]
MAALIDRLPPEILSRIFLILVRASRYATSIRDGGYAEINHPLQISRVCIRWRQVAISTPMLWSFLDFPYSSDDSRKLQYLNLCYERSGNARLSLRLGKHEAERYDEYVDEELACLLGLCATRLDSLAIAYLNPEFAKETLSLLLARGAAGRIRKLALHADVAEDLILADSSLPQDTLDKFLGSLHHLYLGCVSFCWDTMCCRNLMELQLHSLDTNASPSSSQLVSFLNANPMLRKLHIGELGLCTDRPCLLPIKLPELENLELDAGVEFTQWFLTLLTPGARDITLQIYSYITKVAEAQLSDALRQFFQRSRIVTLRVPTIRFVPFSSIAAYLPHLETLGIERPKDQYDLSDINTQTELLPKLHTVELVGCTTRDVESSLRTVLSRSSIRQILFPSFCSVDKAGKIASMNIDEVREWMYGQGITANLRIAPELLFGSSPAPFW